MNKEKDLRMVFWVPYNISETQKGIQAGHASQEYTNIMNDYKKLNSSNNIDTYEDFMRNHKTWMIYNGGTTNNRETLYNQPVGTLNQIPAKLKKFGITFSTFEEPDLNYALTAVCCIIDFNELDFDTELNELYEDWFEGEPIFENEKKELSYFIRTQRFA